MRAVPPMLHRRVLPPPEAREHRDDLGRRDDECDVHVARRSRERHVVPERSGPPDEHEVGTCLVRSQARELSRVLDGEGEGHDVFSARYVS
jgi:hypothetical protein